MLQDERSATSFGLALGGLGPILVGGALVAVRDVIVSANIALALVIVVVAAAAVGGWRAGMVGAVTSALSFDFFHTKPYLSLTIDSQDDVETTLLLLVVGVIVGIIASRARRARASELDARGEIRRIHRVAELVSGGTHPAAVIMATQAELMTLLSLCDCRFEAPPFDEVLPRLARTGAIEGRTEWRLAREGFELPAEGAELPVLHRGNEVGRFVLIPTPGVGVSLEHRVVAVALADQVGGVIGASTRRSNKYGRKDRNA